MEICHLEYILSVLFAKRINHFQLSSFYRETHGGGFLTTYSELVSRIMTDLPKPCMTLLQQYWSSTELDSTILKEEKVISNQ